MALPVRISEPGGVLGDVDGGQVLFGPGLDPAVDPDHAPHFFGPPPELDVVLALVPQLGRAGNAEDDVLEPQLTVPARGRRLAEAGGSGRGRLGIERRRVGLLGQGEVAVSEQWLVVVAVVGRGGEELEGVDDVGGGDEEDEVGHEFGHRGPGVRARNHNGYLIRIFIGKFHPFIVAFLGESEWIL